MDKTLTAMPNRLAARKVFAHAVDFALSPLLVRP